MLAMLELNNSVMWPCWIWWWFSRQRARLGVAKARNVVRGTGNIWRHELFRIASLTSSTVLKSSQSLMRKFAIVKKPDVGLSADISVLRSPQSKKWLQKLGSILYILWYLLNHWTDFVETCTESTYAVFTKLHKHEVALKYFENQLSFSYYWSFMEKATDFGF